MGRFTLSGSVVEAESGAGIGGLLVKVFEAGWGFAGLVGATFTGPNGTFEIATDERRLMMHVHVYTHDGDIELYSTKEPMMWSGETCEVRVPRAQLAPLSPAGEVVLIGDDDRERSVFQPGETLVLAARGLRPATPFRVNVSDRRGSLVFEDVVLSNADGVVEPVALWRFMGLEAASGRGRAPVVEAVEHSSGQHITVTLRERERVVGTASFELDAGARRPIVVSCDRREAVLPSFEAGAHDARVLLLNFPASRARVWMTRSRAAWRPGDPFIPAALANGSVACVDVDLTGDVQTVVIAPAAHVLPGEYAFVVRPLGQGAPAESAELQPTDVIGGRRGAGLVVRRHAWKTG